MSDYRINLDGTWSFWKDNLKQYQPTELPTEYALQIQVPGAWQAQFENLRLDFGTAWYQRSFTLQNPFPAGHVLILHFGAVDSVARVWVNGSPAGGNELGYLPFELDITALVKSGGNTLTVQVEDLRENFDEVPHGKQSWYGPLSGIWQSVWLEQRPAQHIQSVRITATRRQVDVQARLSQPMHGQDRLDYRVVCDDGSVCAAGTSTSPDFMFIVPDPQMWEPEHPKLYRLEVQLRGGQEEHHWEEAFGFREIEVRDGVLMLNGRPLMLRAALDQDYHPHTICTPPSQEYIDSQIQAARDMGLNCLRVHIKVADPRYYEAADRLGLLIWTEIPNLRILSERGKHAMRATLDGMLERDWNHPSIIIWTIINENWGTNLTHDAAHRQWLVDTYRHLKATDPLRLVVDNSACGGNFHVETDIEDYHQYFAMPDHYQHWRAWVKSFGSRPAWTFTPALNGGEDWQALLADHWNEAPRPYAAEVTRTGKEALILSEFGNWGLPDLDRLEQCYGGQEPWWFETGMEWDEGVVYPHNARFRFHQYGLDRVFMDYAEMANASQELEFDALKYEIEQIRLQQAICGYVITEFSDVHWECNGLLDMCRNPKSFTARLNTINADDVIIPEWQRLAYAAGEAVTLPVHFSHYSQADLSGARLRWRLDGFDNLSGWVGEIRNARYTVQPVGEVNFTVPEVTSSQSAALVLEVVCPDGTVTASSRLMLYLLPLIQTGQHTLWSPVVSDGDITPQLLTAAGYKATPQQTQGSIAVVRELSGEVYNAVLNGGSAIWLADGTYNRPAFSLPWAIQPRAGTPLQGDWASSFGWIRPDSIFKRLPPTGGVVNFAFADLTPETVIRKIMPIDFSSRVYSGIFAGWLHLHAGLAAELPLGRGRLLICTFRLLENLGDHPMAAAMLQDMIDYLSVPAVQA